LNHRQKTNWGRQMKRILQNALAALGTAVVIATGAEMLA
jgi:hypothetical protein